MSVSVSMPQLGESVTEGTVTRWLKQEGERVEADEPLLEVSTDKVDTEIPSPVSGVLRGITVAEDETVAVGAELAIIDEEGAAASAAPPAASAPAEAPAAEPEAPAPAAEAAAPAAQAPAAQAPAAQAPPAQAPPTPAPAASAPAAQAPVAANGYGASGYQEPYQQQAPPPAHAYQPQAPQQPQEPQQPAAEAPVVAQEQRAPVQEAAPAQEPEQPAPVQEAAPPQEPEQPAPVQQAAPPQEPEQPAPVQQAAPPQEPQPEQPAGTQEADGVGPQLTSGADGPYVTPLVRKLAAEHGIDLGTVAGTGVGGRIRKQDVLDAARARRGTQEPQPVAVPQQAGPPPEVPQQAAAPAAAPPAAAPADPAAAPAAAASASPAPAADTGRPAIVPSSLRGRTEKLSRSRQVIAQRMVESLQTSAQLTTVVEADVTAIARLRDRAKAAFEAREGVKLSFLPFFALATVEALKVHPKLNAIIDTASGQVTYHDAEHLGIAVDTERGLMVPVIRKAGDLNIAGLARKIADLAARTRAGQVSPDELSGGTFTLTNTGSRGALFDTPIINQPQVGILGTGTVVKRAVVVEDPALGEVIAVRSMVYLALTYDHRLVDGADAARFLVTIKERLEEGAFETELGL
jgi:2-oxoglutarate dehydrogenase E2 component (dihydrolipoamide succinyltransferase)